MNKEQYQNTIIFPIGEPNPYGEFFVGQSYLAPLSLEQVPVKDLPKYMKEAKKLGFIK